MKNALNLQQKLLICVAYGEKIYGKKYSHTDVQLYLYGYYKKKYSIKTLRKTFCQLKSAGLIKSKKYYSKNIPVVSPDGKLAISFVPKYKLVEAWDGKWRLVIASVPEKDRHTRINYYNLLRALGFVSIRDGVFITPNKLAYSANRIATELGIRQHIQILTVESLDQPIKATTKLWDLDTINQQYNQFLIKARRALKNTEHYYWPLKSKELELEFVAIHDIDPHLPAELLPTNWRFTEAYKQYKQLLSQ